MKDNNDRLVKTASPDTEELGKDAEREFPEFLEFGPEFSPEFSSEFSRIFRGFFVLCFPGNRDHKKKKRLFQCQISRQVQKFAIFLWRAGDVMKRSFNTN